MGLRRVADNLRFLGVGKTAVRSAYMACNVVGVLRVYECIKLEPGDLNSGFGEPEAPFESRMLSREEAGALPQQPANNVSPEFVEQALANGDECLAIFEGETLASYGWYSRRPTRMLETLFVHFDPHWAYMYHGYTKPEYRGHRLHAGGLTRALHIYADRGLSGLVSIVEHVNYASKISVYRMGFRQFGTIYQLGSRNHFSLMHTGHCADYGFRIARATRAGSP